MSSRTFKDAKTFENKVKQYISYCKKEDRFPNVAGFCVYCNINRDTFYAQRDYYSDTFKNINEIFEDEAINNKAVSDTMRIFYMKNKCGYKDRQDIDSTTTHKVTIVNSLPKDEADEPNN